MKARCATWQRYQSFILVLPSCLHLMALHLGPQLKPHVLHLFDCVGTSSGFRAGLDQAGAGTTGQAKFPQRGDERWHGSIVLGSL